MSTDFRTIMSNFVATDVYALFNIHVENPQHDCVKTRGGRGGQGLFTQCVKKTSDLAEDGFPKQQALAPSPLKCFCAPNHQILAKSAP